MGIRGFLLLLIVALLFTLWIQKANGPAPEEVDPRCLEEIDAKLKEIRDLGLGNVEIDISSSSFPHCDFDIAM